MKIIIRGELSEPPSEVSCFRDVTLFTSCFLKADVLLESPRGMKDLYYKWLKDHGAYDFINDIVRRNEERGFRISPTKGNLVVDRICATNLELIIGRLRRLRVSNEDFLH